MPCGGRTFLGALVDSLAPARDVNLLLVTHLMPDKLPMIRALCHIINVVLVIPIPYSCDATTKQEVERMGIAVLDCPLGDLLDAEFGARVLGGLLRNDDDVSIVISEVGGYFAPIANAAKETFGHRFLGIVEDTESGHRRYLAQGGLNFPLISVARSTLKESEDRLIGESVAFSVERLVRRLGGTLRGRCVSVLGYGRIGSSCARAFSARGCEILVWDIDPIARVRALADGFSSPSRANAFERPHIIIGASGMTSLCKNDLYLLRDWAILASASSKNVEFAVDSISSQDPEMQIVPRNGGEPVLLAREGTPVNFADAAVVGPVLQLVHGEIIAAISALASKLHPNGIHELSEETRGRIAQIWLDSYVDSRGHIGLNFDV
jgi:adenosylhomocysteinase